MKHKLPTRIREAPPKVQETKEHVLVLCPFCETPHPVAVGRTAVCGTTLRVTAVQTILPACTVHKHKLICFKCGKSGGEMVPFQQGYLHLVDCLPGTRILPAPPSNFSTWARWVYKTPPWLRSRLERITGTAKQIDEIDPTGQPTGVTLGYIFHKGA